MKSIRAILIAVCAACVLQNSARLNAENKTENLILVTLDGVRGQELFGGLDATTLAASLKKDKAEETEPYRRFGAATPKERRELLMPFFWTTWMTDEGCVFGNRTLGSEVEIRNRHRFSYPGYSEILTGQAQDAVIKSNDKIQNPFPTVLDYLQDRLDLKFNQIGVAASWEVMNFIATSRPGRFFANSGFQAYPENEDRIALLSRAQFQTTTPWDSVRHDFYTFHFAMDFLERHHPKVFFLSLGETDDWAHEGRYDRVLHMLNQTDDYLRQLWTFLQSEEQYRGKTTLIMTTDHGRGSNEYNWTSHNDKLEGAKEAWIAVISPDCALRGEQTNHPKIYMDQIASTFCRYLNLDYNQQQPAAGKPIEELF